MLGGHGGDRPVPVGDQAHDLRSGADATQPADQPEGGGIAPGGATLPARDRHRDEVGRPSGLGDGLYGDLQAMRLEKPRHVLARRRPVQESHRLDDVV